MMHDKTLDPAATQIAPQQAQRAPVVSVEDLTIAFSLPGGLLRKRYLKAVSEVSFELYPGQALAVVGESGSGKSTCARALCGLAKPLSGRIRVGGAEIGPNPSRKERQALSAAQQMIFQDPFSSLNPVHRIGHHLERPLRLYHPQLGKAARRARIHELLEKVGLTPPESIAEKFPHELSGGQRQRAAIARALAVGAKVILADEPISMLDVSIRLGILNLMEDMKRDEGIAFLYITHDIATARYFAERTAVMYVGHMVEWGDSDSVTQRPAHPYTQLLISAIPNPDRRRREEPKAGVEKAAKSAIPLWTNTSTGCPFAPRCPKALEQCTQTMPSPTKIGPDHFVRCHAVTP